MTVYNDENECFDAFGLVTGGSISHPKGSFGGCSRPGVTTEKDDQRTGSSSCDSSSCSSSNNNSLSQTHFVVLVAG